MDIGSIANVSSALSRAGTGDAVALTVLKKANEIAENSATQLIRALPSPAKGTTATMGNGVNTFA